MRGKRVKTIKRYLEEHGVQPTRSNLRLAKKVYKRAGRSGLYACVAAGVFEKERSIQSPEVQRVLMSDVLAVKEAKKRRRQKKPIEVKLAEPKPEKKKPWWKRLVGV